MRHAPPPRTPPSQVRQANYLILPHVKSRVLEAAMHATRGAGGETLGVTLDNLRAAASLARGETDIAASQCLFAQAFRQLAHRDAQLLRTVWDGDRVFQVNFVGEDGVDAGGVFRDAVTRVTDDLFSPRFALFAPCPNARHATGLNGEKYVPSASALALQQLAFVGRLMGISLRTRLALPFELPSLVWKRLIGLDANLDDLRAIDNITCQFLEAIRTCEHEGIHSDAAFDAQYGDKLVFTYTGSDGVERELIPGGRERTVTFRNRHAFCDLVESRRLHEFDEQIAAMARGLGDIVPLSALRLFTWDQLEVAVAGDPAFDLDLWRAHTEYKGFDADGETVALFWRVLGSLTPQEQSGFVRFAWGRSRLPPLAHWTTNMKLSNRGNAALPVSHTCFFSVELPDYKTEDEMRRGLLTAIHFGACGILNA
ncbi:hypothetical protein JKP88DRAFT_196590 [Tribonema minus]|uniref:HECT domain-containing protein n=1 Tax=Tribonema minus TaxID=303371 RepID=A0A836C961_9STRA|nr:hypothetical protein JKP88DRAFT_196590 [Tribonema minus]